MPPGDDFQAFDDAILQELMPPLLTHEPCQLLVPPNCTVLQASMLTPRPGHSRIFRQMQETLNLDPLVQGELSPPRGPLGLAHRMRPFWSIKA